MLHNTELLIGSCTAGILSINTVEARRTGIVNTFFGVVILESVFSTNFLQMPLLIGTTVILIVTIEIGVCAFCVMVKTDFNSFFVLHFESSSDFYEFPHNVI